MHGFVHEMRRDGLKRGRRRRPEQTSRSKSAEVNMATGDRTGRQRRLSYGS